MLGNTVQLGINIVSDASGAAAGLQQTSGMFGRISVGAVAAIACAANASTPIASTTSNQ